MKYLGHIRGQRNNPCSFHLVVNLDTIPLEVNVIPFQCHHFPPPCSGQQKRLQICSHLWGLSFDAFKPGFQLFFLQTIVPALHLGHMIPPQVSAAGSRLRNALVIILIFTPVQERPQQREGKADLCRFFGCFFRQPGFNPVFCHFRQFQIHELRQWSGLDFRGFFDFSGCASMPFNAVFPDS
jgi:hypothetical protein